MRAINLFSRANYYYHHMNKTESSDSNVTHTLVVPGVKVRSHRSTSITGYVINMFPESITQSPTCLADICLTTTLTYDGINDVPGYTCQALPHHKWPLRKDKRGCLEHIRTRVAKWTIARNCTTVSKPVVVEAAPDQQVP